MRYSSKISYGASSAATGKVKMNKSSTHENGLKLGRIVVNLNREELEFIDKIDKDALFTTGRHITNNKIIRTFINAMKELKISGEGLSNCEELKERILLSLGIGEKIEVPKSNREG